MDSQEALRFVNQLLIKQNLKGMNTLETHIFEAAWEGRNGLKYQEIADTLKYQKAYVNDAAADLWKRLKPVCNRKVTRANLRAVVEQRQKDDVVSSLPNFVEAPIVPQETNENDITLHQHIWTSEGKFSSVLEKLGIRGGTLGVEEFIEPTQCVRNVRDRLYFMGILGSKWVREGNTRTEFRTFLSRMDREQGRVRFLLIQPGTNAFRIFQEGRGNINPVNTDSLQHFRILIQEFNCLEIKLYNSLPCFRMVFINEFSDPILALSQYSRDRQGYMRSRRGWQVPHLVIEPDGEWSLFFAFEQYYNQVWESSLPLEDYFQAIEDGKSNV